MMQTHKAVRVLVTLAGIIFSFACLIQKIRYPYLKSEFSPDGRYEVKIYRDLLFWGFPGSSSDSQGFCKLIRVRDKKIIAKYYLEMVSMAYHVRWDRFDISDETGEVLSAPVGFDDYRQNRVRLLMLQH